MTCALQSGLETLQLIRKWKRSTLRSRYITTSKDGPPPQHCGAKNPENPQQPTSSKLEEKHAHSPIDHTTALTNALLGQRNP